MSSPVISEIFFLHTKTGRRLCVMHHVSPLNACRGIIIYVQAFGEELNKSRRMATLQAHHLATRGFATIIMDLYGLGDSDGDLADARWEIWKQDLRYLYTWLRLQTNAPVHLLGLRLGALLSIDFSNQSDFPIHQLILWQPCFDGAQFLSEFFRTHMLSDMLNKHHFSDHGKKISDTNDERSSEIVEVLGYDISPALKQSVASVNLYQFEHINANLTWIDIDPHSTTDAPNELSPKKQKHHRYLQTICADVVVAHCQGDLFWHTQEITTCTKLIEMTSAVFEKNSLT